MSDNWRDDPVQLEGWFNNLARTVAIDFDGVLHPYTKGWTGSVPDDEGPIPGAAATLIALRAAGYKIIVFSTRADHHEGLVGIQEWLNKWDLFMFVSRVTHEKPPAVAYIDDRAVSFTGDWEHVLSEVERLANGRAHGAGN